MSQIQLQAYYADRAAEYEDVYRKPERQESIAWLNSRLKQTLMGCTVLEVACGTGFWTQTLAEVARSVVATDINREVLEIAEQKPLPPGRVTFSEDDAFSLQNVPRREFTGGFSGFWWSHIPKSQIDLFLTAFHAKLQPGAKVMFADNCYVAGSNHAISRTDEDGNTYQERVLGNGTHYEVLKNFPARQELEDTAAAYGTDVQWEASAYFWCLSYTLKYYQHTEII